MMKMMKMSAAILAGVLIAGCGDKMAEDAVLVVNGEALTRSSLEADIAAIIAAQGDAIPTNALEYAKATIKNQLIEGFLLEKVLLKKAHDDAYVLTEAEIKEAGDKIVEMLSAAGPEAPKTIEEYFEKFPLGAERGRAQFTNGLLIDKMMKDVLERKLATIDVKARAEELHKNFTEQNAAAAASEAEAKAKIEALHAELAAVPSAELAEKFAALAKQHSQCTSAENGGDLGEPFTHGRMVPEFDKAAFEQPIGQLCAPVKTQYGYHLILVTNRIPATDGAGDVPGEPEKASASHILIKCPETRPVPSIDELIGYIKQMESRQLLQEFVASEVLKAKIESKDPEFDQYVPHQPEEENLPLPVENGEEK